MVVSPKTAHAVTATVAATAVISTRRDSDHRFFGGLAHMTMTGVTSRMPTASPSHQVTHTAAVSAGAARLEARSAMVPTVAAITGDRAPTNRAKRRVVYGRSNALSPLAKRLTSHHPASASRVFPT